MKYTLAELLNIFSLKYEAKISMSMDDIFVKDKEPPFIEANQVLYYNPDGSSQDYRWVDSVNELLNGEKSSFNQFKRTLLQLVEKPFFPFFESKFNKLAKKHINDVDELIAKIKQSPKTYVKLNSIKKREYLGPQIFSDDHKFYHLQINSDLSFEVTVFKINNIELDTLSEDLNPNHYSVAEGDFSVTYDLISENGSTFNFTDYVNNDYSKLSSAINSKFFVNKDDLLNFIKQSKTNISNLEDDFSNA